MGDEIIDKKEEKNNEDRKRPRTKRGRVKEQKK